ncbi:DUF1761 domain-containing protein [Alkalimonas collagenimarina]|uniref:DUF1761 domain-containing protein n=1 Tax=Alkalimonas collagenimarina TaxID=400390 RepID=A0ABT9H3P4_9GAMM|nr:DUF1761 domain-containing protein [Alkalimonas collagenimarina]MDP4537913.1 DUF1761 domain-containing protein [Alkalimonas collagenimarina]
METINYMAIVAAAVSAFLIGGLWYSPLLFGKAWMKEMGFTDADLQQGNMAKIFGLAFIFTLIMAFCLAMFLNDASIGASEGAFYGFLAGFGWIFFALAVNSLYERRSWRYSLINGGYWTVVFTLMGFILGAWR